MNIKAEDMKLIGAITDLKEIPSGALNIRVDGKALIRNSSPNISVGPNDDGTGLRVEVKAGTKNETVHVPVIVTQAGFKDKVYNTFIINEDADVTIVAGCGIHNDSHADSGHDGIHTIVVKPGAHMKYVEKHYGEGSGRGKKILNPTTDITVENGASAEMELIQIAGVDDTLRSTTAHIHEQGSLKITERLMTHGEQNAESIIDVYLAGPESNAQILSRAVAKDKSRQVFRAALIGQDDAMGHLECDAIIMDQAQIQSVPQLVAEDARAVLTHEAAIGKIAGEQLVKLMSLGLSEEEAVNTIIEGFLK